MAWELFFKPFCISIHEVECISKHYAHLKNLCNDWKHSKKKREFFFSPKRTCNLSIHFLEPITNSGKGRKKACKTEGREIKVTGYWKVGLGIFQNLRMKK